MLPLRGAIGVPRPFSVPPELSGVQVSAARFCARRIVRAIRRTDAGCDSRAQIQRPAPSRSPARRDACGGGRPAGPRGAGGNAGSSSAAASVKACAKGRQPGTPAGGACASKVEQHESGLEAYARPERGSADSCYREPGQSHAASTADQPARSLCGPRSDRRGDETRPAYRRHFHDRSYGTGGGTGVDAVRGRKRLGGHPGAGAAGFRSAGRIPLGP